MAADCFLLRLKIPYPAVLNDSTAPNTTNPILIPIGLVCGFSRLPSVGLGVAGLCVGCGVAGRAVAGGAVGCPVGAGVACGAPDGPGVATHGG